MTHVSISMRFRAMIASAALAATFGPMVGHAQEPTRLNTDTAAALAAWRTATVALVDQPFQDIVTASYSGRASTADADWFNKAMVRRSTAEQAAFRNLDPGTASLISAYYQQPDLGQLDSGQVS